MAASSGFGSLSNVSGKIQNAINKPIALRCQEIDDILRNSSSKDLRNVLPGLLENIFGFGSEPGWGLDLILKSQNFNDFEAVMRLLAPEGPLLSLIYSLQADPYLTYEFPFSCLPSPTRHTIEEGNMPLFYVNKLQYNYSKPVLALSAFEFYMFHFCYTLVNPQWQGKSFNWNNITDVLYPCLLDQYLKHFLPLNRKNLPHFPQTQASPVRSPVLHQTPYTSGKHSPSSGTQCRNRTRLGLLRTNLISPQKPLSQNSPVADKAEAEIWWSETFIQILAEFWLNQNSLEAERLLPTQSMEHFSPSNNHIRLTRLLLKHIHHFTNSAAPEIVTSPYQTPDTSPLDDFKRSLAPQILQKNIYSFLKHSFERWPLDSSFRLVLELWLTYIQPWRYLDETRAKQQDKESHDQISDQWFPFVRDNFLFYTSLFQEFVQRVKRMDMTSLHNTYMVFRVGKVFSLPGLPQLIREVERLMHTSAFKLAQQDLGGSYIAPEISMVLRVQISDLERPDFNYVNFFGDEMNREVMQILHHISAAQSAVQSTQPEKKAEKTGFWSFLDFSFFEGTTKAYGDLSGAEVKKLLTHLEQAYTNLCTIFGISPASLTPQGNQSLDMTGDQSRLNQTYTITPPTTPDCVQTAVGPKLTPLGRYQLMNGIRKFDITYSGDPDLQPIRSFENSTMVRVLYRMSAWINKQYKKEISALYHRKDFLGKMSQVYFAAPLSPHKTPRSPMPRGVAESLQQPRLSLRFLGSYQTLLYLGLMFVVLRLGWGVGAVGYVFFLLLCVLVFGVFRALVQPEEIKVS